MTSDETMRRRCAMWILRSQGLSYRAIGAAFGVSRTVANEAVRAYEMILVKRARVADSEPSAVIKRLRCVGAITESSWAHGLLSVEIPPPE